MTACRPEPKRACAPSKYDTFAVNWPQWHPPRHDAPHDCVVYARQNGNWVPVLPMWGGTLTGFLELNADPADPLGAATKQYVDSQISILKTFVDGEMGAEDLTGLATVAWVNSQIAALTLSTNTQFTTINNQITALQAANTALQNQVNAMQSQINNLISFVQPSGPPLIRIIVASPPQIGIGPSTPPVGTLWYNIGYEPGVVGEEARSLNVFGPDGKWYSVAERDYPFDEWLFPPVS